jgi:D-amino-acid oxidase
MDVLLIGCGVSGLSSGVRLLEAGHRVRAWAHQFPQETTSAIAAALWAPYEVAPLERVLPWAERTLREFLKLAEVPGTGVVVRDGLELFRAPQADFGWRSSAPGFRRATAAERPASYADGCWFRVPVIEMPIYLDYLLDRFRQLGGTLERRTVTALAEAFEHGDLVVNCTGLGARRLLDDEEMRPLRGQVVWVEQVGLDCVLLDDSDRERPTYVVPRSRDCVLGGTVEDDAEGLQPDPATAEAILQRCLALEPRLRAARVLAHRVGLRPGRSAVRLERQTWAPGKEIVHNYGHGGAGVTLSWGCADAVVELVRGER